LHTYVNHSVSGNRPLVFGTDGDEYLDYGTREIDNYCVFDINFSLWVALKKTLQVL
jgi:hypothetical protein